MPSWMRAPPESLNPTTGAPALSARSRTLQILAECISPREPPRAVKSWKKANTGLPFTSPWPVTTPSEGITCLSIPEAGRPMGDKSVDLLEAALVEEELGAFARRELACLCCLSTWSSPPILRASASLRAQVLHPSRDRFHENLLGSEEIN